MARLTPIERGPWASRKAATRREFGEGLDGPDYDPGASASWYLELTFVPGVESRVQGHLSLIRLIAKDSDMQGCVAIHCMPSYFVFLVTPTKSSGKGRAFDGSPGTDDHRLSLSQLTPCELTSPLQAALIYTTDELDPYRDMPISSTDESLLLPTHDAERPGMNGGFREAPPVRTGNGLGHGRQGGHSMAGRRGGGPLSAQASHLAILHSFGYQSAVVEKGSRAAAAQRSIARGDFDFLAFHGAIHKPMSVGSHPLTHPFCPRLDLM